MDNVDRILSFIDENNNEPETQQTQQQEQQEQTEPEQKQDNTTNSTERMLERSGINTSTGEYTNINNSNANYDYTRDDKQYKSMLRKLNNNIKKSRYP